MTEVDFPVEPLGDEIVSLRPWSERDVPDGVMAFADPTVLRYSWPHSRPYTERDARTFFAEQKQDALAGRALNFAVAEPGDPEVVLGGASLYGIDLEAGRVAVGYWLKPDARGRGVATHAVRLLSAWAIGSLGVARVELECAPENELSRKVAERCGFSFEEILRSHLPFKGGRRDTAVYSFSPSGAS